jgi:Xaa-Pro aminopeptidase
MVKALCRELEARGMAEGEIGIVGADVLTWSAHQALQRALPGVVWSDASDILEQLRLVKSPGEVELLRRASEIGSRATDAMMEAAVPGATHGEVMLAGLSVLVPAGGILYNSFMSSGRGGANAGAVSSVFPTYAAEEPLSDGQWFHVGLSGAVGGYYFDHARSVSVGEPTADQIAVYEAPIAAVQAGIAAIVPGATAADVAKAGLAALEERGFQLEGSFQGFGHGIGMGWDSPWLIPDDHTPLVPGMVLCVERSIRHNGYYGDFEETVLVTEDGTELLTDAVIRRW